MKSRRSLFLIAALCLVATMGMAQSVTLNWISWWGEDTLKPIAQGFEKTHPNIKVNIRSYPFDAYFNKVQADMAAKASSTDILAVDAPSVAEYTVRHYVIPLNKYFTKSELASSIASAVLEASYYNGTLSALPTFSSNHVLYYNPVIFKAANVTPPGPDKPWTWEQVAEAARKLTKTENGTTTIWGLLYEQVNQPYEILPLPESLGADPLDFNSKGWLKAMQFYYDCYNTWKISANVANSNITDQLFASGHAAMMVGGEWNAVGWAKDNVNFNYAPYPYFEGGKIVVATDAQHLGVAAYSKHVPEAVEFIKYATLGEGPTVEFEAGASVLFPANIPLLNKIEQDPKYAKFPWSIYRLANRQVPYTVPRPVTPFWDAYQTLGYQMFNNISTGTSPATALQAAQKQWERIKQSTY
jgi:fructooligosaccharide transport system substrate-binding protein